MSGLASKQRSIAPAASRWNHFRDAVKLTAEYLAGYDIFISYARADGLAYAASVANALSEKGYACFFDQWSSDPGQELPRRLRHALKRSHSLVCICTPSAAASAAVLAEIEIFRSRAKPLVPIDAGGIVGPLKQALLGLPIQIENSEGITKGAVSEPVILRITNSCNFTKRNVRLNYVFWMAAALIGIAAVSLVFLTRQVDQTNDNLRTASESLETAKKDVQSAEASAREQLSRAEVAQELADEAEAKNKLLSEQTVLKKRELRSIELATQSLSMISHDFVGATSKAIQAAEAFASRAAESALERILTHPKMTTRLVHGTTTVVSGAFVNRAGASTVVTATSDAELYVWDLASRKLVKRQAGQRADLPPSGFVRFAPDGTHMLHLSGFESTMIRSVSDWKVKATPTLHSGIILSSEFDATSSRVVTSDGRGNVIERNIVNGSVKYAPTIFSSDARAIYHPSKHLVIAASRDGNAVQWDPESDEIKPYNDCTIQQAYRPPTRRPRPERELGCQAHSSDIFGLTVSPDGVISATYGRDGFVKLWSTETTRLVASLGGHVSDIVNVAFSPKLGFIASVDYSGTTRIWRATDARTAKLEHDPLRERLTFANDLGAATWVPHLTLYGEIVIGAYDPLAGPTLLAFSTDNKWFATVGRNNKARLWDLERGRLVTELAGNLGAVVSVSFDASGARLLTTSASGDVTVWDVSKLGAFTERRHTATEAATVLRSTQTPRFVVSVVRSPSVPDPPANYQTCERLSLFRTDGEFERNLESSCGGSLLSVQLDNNSDELFVARGGGDFAFYDVITGKQKSRAVLSKSSGVESAAFMTPCGRVIGLGRKGSGIWDIKTGAQLPGLPVGIEEYRYVAWLPISRKLLYSDGKHIRTSHVDSGCNISAVVAEYSAPDRISFFHSNGNGDRLLIGEDNGQISILDASNLRPVLRLPTIYRMPIEGSISPDGRLAVVSYKDGGIRVYELEGGAEIWSQESRARWPLASFFADSRRVAVFGESIRAYDCPTCESFPTKLLQVRRSLPTVIDTRK